jgi:uncharacterized protein
MGIQGRPWPPFSVYTSIGKVVQVKAMINRFLVMFLLFAPLVRADPAVEFVQTPYQEPKVVFDFYFDEPQKINAALYWIRSLINPLMEAPYDMAPEMMDIKVIIHGTEIVTLARHNYAKYKDAVERMRYYAALGVEFRVCGIAAQDYGYKATDFYEFVKLTPSAIAELAYWQRQGYAVIAPAIKAKKYTIEEIR